MTPPGVSQRRVDDVLARETERFAELRPRGTRLLEDARRSMPLGVPMNWMSSAYEHPPVFVESGSGATFTDVDGNSYLDFNLADTSMFTGYGDEALTRAAAERVAAGSQFLLPTEDALEVSVELARRFGLPKWQYTSSATQANTEAIRVARTVTGRNDVVMFDGKYHGHADELLAESGDEGIHPLGRGIPRDATRHVRIVAYNDLEAVEAALASGDVACVMAEAAITNCGVVMPADGFHAGLRRLLSDAGSLLVLDETHTFVAGPGGLTGRWDLDPDVLVTGKSVSGGIPLGCYGMKDEVAAVLDDASIAWDQGVATGGTMFGNALSMAAARVTLAEVLTDDVYESATALGEKLADGIESVADAHGLEWRAHRLFNRSGYTHAPELPADAEQARASFDTGVYNLQRLYAANRGVWDAIDSAGPACGIRHTNADVERYLDVLDSFLGEVTG
jgi:glutamate-1-semialdehyde 2,1-aminomutase